MLRRSPCELYLKFLLVHPDELDDEAVELRAHKEQVDCIGREYLYGLRVASTPPSPFHPTDPYHLPSQRFLFKQGIRRLFFPDESIKSAKKILTTARAKEFAEAMIISEAPSGAIAATISKKYGVNATAESVDAFKLFFWNIDLLDSTELRVLLRLRSVPIVKEEDPRTGTYISALNTAGYKDPRRVAADQPHSPVTAILSQMRMGMSPSRIDLGRVLQRAQELAAMRLCEELGEAGKSGPQRAFHWSIVLKNVTEVMEATVSPESTLQEHITALRLKTRPSSAPVIHQLTGGEHTMDLQPKPEPGSQDAIDDAADAVEPERSTATGE